jgi:hypothetical protein
MKKILATFTLFSCLIGSAAATPIFEDDFGNGSRQGAVTGDFGNWSVVAGNIDVWTKFGFVGNWIDMNGTNALGSIETQATFSFSANSDYLLSFLLGNNQHTVDNGLTYGLRNDDGILASGVIANVKDFLGSSSSSVVTLLFRPDSDVEGSIFFTSTGSRDWGAAIIDNVKLVPEPSTLAILALGLIGLGARRFKK